MPPEHEQNFERAPVVVVVGNNALGIAALDLARRPRELSPTNGVVHADSGPRRQRVAFCPSLED